MYPSFAAPSPTRSPAPGATASPFIYQGPPLGPGGSSSGNTNHAKLNGNGGHASHGIAGASSGSGRYGMGLVQKLQQQVIHGAYGNNSSTGTSNTNLGSSSSQASLTGGTNAVGGQGNLPYGMYHSQLHSGQHGLNNHHDIHGSHQHMSQSSLSNTNGTSLSNNMPLEPHWIQQLDEAVISRRSGSPFHHARAAAAKARGAVGSNALTITDPSKPLKAIVNGSSVKTSEHPEDQEGHDDREGSVDGEDGENTWYTLDMGGIGLNALGPNLFKYYQHLTTLYINHNNLTVLPPEICRLTNLTILDASHNRLTTLPEEIGLLTSLRKLYLFDNNLVNLPFHLGSLHHLEQIGIEGNPLSEGLRGLIMQKGVADLIHYLRDACPVPPSPPEREWITMDSETLTSDVETTSIMCYNILCERYATEKMYGYTPSWALDWAYRKDLIIQEVQSIGADLICLQEVSELEYESCFTSSLKELYGSVYAQKTRSRTMRDDEKRSVDGCATFFRSDKYVLVDQHIVDFRQHALARPDLQKEDALYNRVMIQDNIAVATLLESKATGSKLIVVNVHVHWDPAFKDVKMVQVAMMMEELNKISSRFARMGCKVELESGKTAPRYSDAYAVPMLICGDFNSVPESGVYEFMAHGEASAQHEDFMDHKYGDYTRGGLSHRFKLKSAYSSVGELKFTNLTPDFTGVIDYIWYTANNMSITGVLGEIDKDYVKKVVGFPNAHFPSDHICIYGEFKIKSKDVAPSLPPPKFGSSSHDARRR